MHYSLVLSDLHFGDPRCSLHSMKTAEKLVEKLQPFQPLKQIYLLGDILDLQLANWAQAVEGRFIDDPKKRGAGFRYFLNFLIEKTKASDIFYVPGNHDYKIFDYHSIEHSLIRPLRTGKKLSGRMSFFKKFPASFLQGLIQNTSSKFHVVYPHATTRVNGGNLILTHGHLFDSSQGLFKDTGKIFSENAGKAEIAKIRNSFFRRVSFHQNILNGFSVKRELRDLFTSLYHPVTHLRGKLRHKKRKTFLTSAMRKAIEHYLRFCCRGTPQGVIFGHTHLPGGCRLHTDNGVKHVWNTGTFLRETPTSPAGSFITINHGKGVSLDEAVQVHLLT